MSSCLPLIFMALTSFWMLPKGGFQAPKSDSVADLLLADDVDKAEALLAQQPKTADTIAFQGEIEFRRGNFDKAESLYRESLRMDDKTGRAHFGLGKLALAKLKGPEAVAQLKRAVALSPREPMFHLYAGEAYGVQKNHAGQKAELQEYVQVQYLILWLPGHLPRLEFVYVLDY